MKMPRIVATCLVISLFAALIEPQLGAQTSGDPGRWAYPLEAVLQSDPPLIGDFVPCIFDVDEHGSFRAIKVPGAEQNMQTAAQKASYKIFYATSKGGTPQPTALTITLEQIINLNPTSLTFSDQPLGTTSLAQAVAVTNRGTAALNITGVTPTGTNANDFTPVNGCGPALAAGQNCSISLTFQPKGTVRGRQP